MIYYKNNYGQIICLDRWPYKMLAKTDLFDYEWRYDTKNEINPKITRFYRNMVQKRVSIVIANELNFEHAYSQLIEAVEKDVVNVTPGKLYVDDSYISCYFIKSDKEKWKKSSVRPTVEFTIICENGSWITETKTSFRSGIASNDGNLNYPFNYPFNYASSGTVKKINNLSYAPSDFEVTIYGACNNPSFTIGGHLYGVDCSLETGEYLIINSITKKIYKVKPNGEAVNQFNLRNHDSYIFEKIPCGENAVTWNGLFGFDMVLLSERSEPLWI